MATDRYKKKLIEEGNKAVEDKKWQEASEIFYKLDKIFKDNYGVLSNLSLCLMNNKEYDKSIEILDKLEKIAPLDVKVNFFKGRCLELQKKYDESLESYKKCLRIDKDHQESWIKCADILGLKGEFPKAISLYKKIYNDTKMIDIAIKLAATLASNSQKQEAVEILEQILKEFPNNDTAKNLIKKISQI